MSIQQDIVKGLKSNKIKISDFDAIVSNLMLVLAEKENKKIIIDYKYANGSFDGLLPDGILNIEGPTAFEIKKLSKRNKNVILKSMSSQLHELNIDNLIIITDEEIDEENQGQLVSEVHHFSPLVKIIFWGVEFIAKLIEGNINRITNDIINFNEIILRNELGKNENEQSTFFENENAEKINELRKKYNLGNLTLFVGAGVSQSAGVPSWNQLVSQLFVSLIDNNLETYSYTEKEKKILSNTIMKMQNSGPLIDVRYIRAGLGDRFISIVKKSLYSNQIKESELIKAISKLCVPRPGIKSVVTYNFDDLLERTLEETGVRFKTIHNDNYNITNNDLGIYHVHGYLPQKSKIKSEIVFSEEAYHDMFLDPYSWSNIVQLNHLTETTCLFLGLSMTDPNLRRILEISAKKIKVPKHYVILKKVKFTEDLDWKNETYRDYLIAHYKILERSYIEFGLNTIWVEEYDEIPDIINEIRRRSV